MFVLHNSVAVGHTKNHNTSVYLNNEPIPWSHQFKYLGIVFNVRTILQVDLSYIKRKFYAALNSLLARCCNAVETVKLKLIESFCLPLLTYCTGALELTTSAINELGVCWNDAYRKIFHYNRWESVKQVQYFFGSLDFKHMYDLARHKFLSVVSHKVPYLKCFYTSLDIHYKIIVMLHHFYVGATELPFTCAVHEHFQECALPASSYCV